VCLHIRVARRCTYFHTKDHNLGYTYFGGPYVEWKMLVYFLWLGRRFLKTVILLLES
jgi:hypothetical protein